MEHGGDNDGDDDDDDASRMQGEAASMTLLEIWGKFATQWHDELAAT